MLFFFFRLQRRRFVLKRLDRLTAPYRLFAR